MVSGVDVAVNEPILTFMRRKKGFYQNYVPFFERDVSSLWSKILFSWSLNAAFGAKFELSKASELLL